MKNNDSYSLNAEKIRKMHDFKLNYPDYDFPAPNREVINLSLNLLDQLLPLELIPTSIGASTEGGIGFTFQNGKDFAYLEFFNDGEVVFLTDIAGTNRKVWASAATNKIAVINALENFTLHLFKYREEP